MTSNKSSVKIKTQALQEYTVDTRYPAELSVMQNRMIEAWNNMGADEKRIFVLASPLVRLVNATEQTKFSISAKDYAKACGISENSAYGQLNQAAKALRGRYFSYINAKNHRVSVHWVIRIEYSNAEISFYFPEEVLYMLSIFNSKNPYTKFKVETALKLKGSHAIQLYQLLKQHEKIGFRQFEIEEFKQMFQLTEKYKILSNLRVRVIEPAVKEITEKTELDITFSQIKQGNKIVGFYFKINKEKRKKLPLKSNQEITPNKVLSLIVKNKLFEKVKNHGESYDDLKLRIISDFKKEHKKEFWLKLLDSEQII